MFSNKKLAAAVLLTLTLLVPTSIAKKRDGAPLKARELKEAEQRLNEMGYSTGRVDGVIDSTTRQALITFQKWEGRKVTGSLTRATSASSSVAAISSG